MTTDSHIGPIPDKDWPEDIKDLRSGFAGSLNVYRTMAHHSDLLRAWSGLREHIVNHNALGRQWAELVILRTGFRLGSDYEWSQHILRARKYGLEDARIATMREDPTAMDRDDAVIATAVDELFDNRALTAPTQDSLTGLVGTRGVLDLMATVAFYCNLGFILNTFAVPLDDDVTADLAAVPFGKG